MRIPRTAAACLLVVCATCATPPAPSPAAPATEVAPAPSAPVAAAQPAPAVPPAPAVSASPALPVARADDGASRLQVTSVFVVPPQSPSAHPRLHVQGRFETDHADLVLAGAAPGTPAHASARLVMDGDPREIVATNVAIDRFGMQDVSVEDVDAGAAPGRIRSLVVELRLLRVREWATVTLAAEPGAGRKQAVQGPYRYLLTPAKKWVWLGAWGLDPVTDDVPAGPPAYEARGFVLRAIVRNARGAKLDASGGGARGVMMFYDLAHPDAELAWPVTATLRVPAVFDVVRASYRFTGLDVPSAPR